MTSAAADVINFNGRKIGRFKFNRHDFAGKYAYFGLDLCINVVLNLLWASQERQVLMFFYNVTLWKSAGMTSAQASDDVGSTIDLMSSMPDLYLVI